MGAKITIYGLAACDTTRAARKWLENHGIAYVFHDVREDGISRALVERWVEQLGWEKVLNKASTTWRELPAANKEGLGAKIAVALILAHPTLVKRPVIEVEGAATLGFKPAVYEQLFG